MAPFLCKIFGKQDRDSPVPEWKDGKTVFAKSISCMGMIDRELEANRFQECPCLAIPIIKNTVQELKDTIVTIVRLVSQNKLAELMSTIPMYTEEGPALGGINGLGLSLTDFSWDKLMGKDMKVEAPLYNRDADFRARLQSLRTYLRARGTNVIEPFDVGLPTLPVPENTSWFTMNGPVYMFMQNKNNGLLCRIIFPSMSKQGQPILNYDNLGKAHRWVERIINSILYTSGVNCNTPCTKTPVTYSSVKFAFPKCYRYKYFMPCGSKNTAKKIKPGSKLEYYSVYQLNLSHPSIAPYFSTSRIRDTIYSVLPSDWEMYVGTRYMLMSENKKYFMLLMKDRLGIFYNQKNEDLVKLNRGEAKQTKGVYKYGIKFKGVATKMLLESGVLTIYGVDPSNEDQDDILFRVELASNGATQPMALYLHDDGRLSLFDGDNKNALNATTFEAVLDKREEVMSITRDYDPNVDYQQRIQRLLQWIVARKLVETIIMPNAENIGELMQKLSISYSDLSPGAPFDPTVNYQERIMHLFGYLRSQYPNMALPSDTTLQTKFKSASVTYENELQNQTPYDPNVERNARLAQLKN